METNLSCHACEQPDKTNKNMKIPLRSIRKTTSPNLIIMLIIAISIGIIAGYGAIGFRLMIGFFHNLLFFIQLNFYYDANVHTSTSYWGIGIIFVPVIGAICVTWIVKNFAPGAKGHGVPEVIDAIYYNDGKIRPSVAFFKSVASAISIGSGGSVGREGPIIQIGAAFGSAVGQWLKIPIDQCIILIAAGAGAGIAATFNSPIGGILFATELLLVAINARSLAAVMIATVTATYISRYYLGLEPSFNIPELAIPSQHLTQLLHLCVFLPFGIAIGLAATLFVKMIYWFEDIFTKLPINDYCRHAFGMLLLGIMIYLLLHYTGHYYVQGIGYATIVDALTKTLTNPWFLLLLCGLKLLATSLTLGSGASGGVFSPALFMGATLGSAFGHFSNILFPEMAVNPALFAVAGMAGMVAGSTGAALTAIAMLFEMTRDYNAILAIIITVSLAYLTRMFISQESIYTLKLLRRGHFVPEGLQAATTSNQQAKIIMNENIQIIDINELALHIPTITCPVIVSENKQIKGIVHYKTVQNEPLSTHESIIDEHYLLVSPQTSLLNVLHKMQENHCYSVLVVKDVKVIDSRTVIGSITTEELAHFMGKTSRLISEPL